MFNSMFKFFNMKTIQNLCMFFVIVAFFSCGVDHMNQPKGGTAIPAQIFNWRVVDISGASIIYYDRPDDINLHYVKAVYTTDDGLEMSATASYFTDSILIRGFRDACSVNVKLYSVNSAEGMSEPVTVPISPQTPPYLTAFEDMVIGPAFLGVNVKTFNETGAKLAIAMYKKDPITERFEEIGLGFFQEAGIVDFNVKGQDTIENVYMVKIRDEWGRWSGEKEETLTPWFEKELDKRDFQELRLCNIIEGNAGDAPDQEGQILPSNYWGHFMHWWGGSDVRFSYLFDGRFHLSTGSCYHTRPTSVLPQHFSIDLGRPYTLSRIVIHGRVSDTEMGAGSNDTQHVFRNGFPKHIQLYGATYNGPDITQLQDDIDNPDYWIDLGYYTLRRADGSLDLITGGSTDFGTVEDRLLLQNGHEFEFPLIGQQIRYFRFRTWECYNPAVNAVMLGEITLFGTEN